METLEEIKNRLDTLNCQRSQLITAGWYLQGCWLAQVKPGGTARTSRHYWQVRSQQPIFDGKKLKHLKDAEVESYRSAIERGRQLKQIDRQIASLQQQLENWQARLDVMVQTTPSPQLKSDSHQRLLTVSMKMTDDELIAKSRDLRATLHQLIHHSETLKVTNQQLKARSMQIIDRVKVSYPQMRVREK